MLIGYAEIYINSNFIFFFFINIINYKLFWVYSDSFRERLIVNNLISNDHNVFFIVDTLRKNNHEVKIVIYF